MQEQIFHDSWFTCRASAACSASSVVSWPLNEAARASGELARTAPAGPAWRASSGRKRDMRVIVGVSLAVDDGRAVPPTAHAHSLAIRCGVDAFRAIPISRRRCAEKRAARQPAARHRPSTAVEKSRAQTLFRHAAPMRAFLPPAEGAVTSSSQAASLVGHAIQCHCTQ